MDGASAVAGLSITALQVFQACITAYKFFDTAKHIGSHGDSIRSKLQWEQYRLLEWGERTGLAKAPDDRINWDYAVKFLKEQEVLLTSAEKLRSKYHLDVSEELVDVGSAEDNGPRESLIGKLLPKQKLLTTAARAIQSSNSPIKRLRWASTGKERAEDLLRDIADLNNRLFHLLDSADIERSQLRLAALLRDVISRSTNAAEVDAVRSILDPPRTSSAQALAAAASLKRIRLVVGADKRPDEIQPRKSHEMMASLPTVRRLSARKIAPHPTIGALTYTGMEMAQYRGQRVLVEWKTSDDAVWKKMEDQVASLSLLLTGMQDESFHALPCVGYAPWKERTRFALVSELPVDPENPDSCCVKSLYELMKEQPVASLTQRYRIALELADTVLQLHTAGWLHKGIRSENVIFVGSTECSTEMMLRSKAFVVGYEYARPDTEAGSALTELPNSSLDADLYRHPDARGLHRQSYQKRFDMYALGCVLLEVALWRPLVDIQSSFTGLDVSSHINIADEEKKDLSMPSLLEFAYNLDHVSNVSHYVGESFCDAIVRCLSLPSDVKDALEVSLEAQKEVVDMLRKCRC